MEIKDIYYNSHKTLNFFVEGNPIPQARPRFVRATGVAYDKRESREYKALVKEAAEEAMYKVHWQLCHKDMPVKIVMVIYKPIAKSEPLWIQRLAKSGAIAPLKRTGDAENIAKGIMDAMSGVVYADDCQVYSLHIEQRYSEKVGVDVEVTGLFVDNGELMDISRRLFAEQKKKNALKEKEKALKRKKK